MADNSSSLPLWLAKFNKENNITSTQDVRRVLLSTINNANYPNNATIATNVAHGNYTTSLLDLYTSVPILDYTKGSMSARIQRGSIDNKISKEMLEYRTYTYMVIDIAFADPEVARGWLVSYLTEITKRYIGINYSYDLKASGGMAVRSYTPDNVYSLKVAHMIPSLQALQDRYAPISLLEQGSSASSMGTPTAIISATISNAMFAVPSTVKNPPPYTTPETVDTSNTTPQSPTVTTPPSIPKVDTILTREVPGLKDLDAKNQGSTGTKEQTPQSTNIARSEFYLETQVFLEGVEIPYNSISVGYGIYQPPTCQIVVPASSLLRSIPETTKVHIFFKDLVPDDNGEYLWRLLFDGEVSGVSYGADAYSAQMSISAIHSTAHISLMQLMALDIGDYITNPQANMAGEATMQIVVGQNSASIDVVRKILDIHKNGTGTKFKGMADIAYLLLKSVISDGNVTASAVGKYYYNKLADTPPLSWKVLKRMYGVQDSIKNVSIIKPDKYKNLKLYGEGGSSSSGENPGGNYSNNYNHDSIITAYNLGTSFTPGQKNYMQLLQQGSAWDVNDSSVNMMVDSRVVTMLNIIGSWSIREIGKPLIVTSANRPGGRSGSNHTRGFCADFVIAGTTNGVFPGAMGDGMNKFLRVYQKATGLTYIDEYNEQIYNEDGSRTVGHWHIDVKTMKYMFSGQKGDVAWP